MNGTLLVVPAGCLDSEVPIKPQGHVYMTSKANWDNDLDKVPKLDQLPKANKT